MTAVTTTIHMAGGIFRYAFNGDSNMTDKADAGDNDLAETVAQLQTRVDVLDKQLKDTRYIVYKLLYEMGGKEVIERKGKHDA
jgi:hypothetical protein